MLANFVFCAKAYTGGFIGCFLGLIAPVQTSIYVAAGVPAQYDHLQVSEQRMPDV